MEYTIIFEKNADNQLQKINVTQQRIIVNWITKKFEMTEDPRVFGRPLKGNLKDYWRYRVGDYRIIAEINDREIKVLIIDRGYRKIFLKKFKDLSDIMEIVSDDGRVDKYNGIGDGLVIKQ